MKKDKNSLMFTLKLLFDSPYSIFLTEVKQCSAEKKLLIREEPEAFTGYQTDPAECWVHVPGHPQLE